VRSVRKLGLYNVEKYASIYIVKLIINASPYASGLDYRALAHVLLQHAIGYDERWPMMPREKALYLPMVRVPGKYVTGAAIVRQLREIVRSYDAADVRQLRTNENWLELVGMLQYSPVRAAVVNGLPVAIGGIDAGRENPKHGLIETLRAAAWQDTCWHIHAGEDYCPRCEMRLGLDVRYTLPDGQPGIAPSLALSHSLPVVLGGTTSPANVIVGCARCNKRQGYKYDTAIDAWLKTIKVPVYKPI
jgi:hypothetical protein